MKLVLNILVITIALSISACTVVTKANKRTTDNEKASESNANLGAQYLQRGDLQLASEKLTKALEQNSSNAHAHLNMGRLQFAIDQHKTAQKHFKRAVALEPNNADNRNAYGIFLCSTGDIDGAEKEFGKAASNPFYDTPEFALDNAGVCMLEVDRLADAESYLLKAVQRNPNFGNAFLHIAELRFKENRLTIAESYLARYHALDDISPPSLLLGFEISRALGDGDGAKRYANTLLNTFSDSKEAGEYLARPQ